MPLLADDYGLYYNQDMFDAAGIKSPPKTISELDADAKKLTQRSSDGTIEVAGYVPTSGFYESVPAHYGAAVGRAMAGRRRQVEPRERPGVDRLCSSGTRT